MTYPFKYLCSALTLSWLAFGAASTVQAIELPAVPTAIKEAGQLRAGVRCDQPPYGFQDNSGQFAGVEVEMAKQVATWALGSADKVTFTCVTAENRVPQLLGRKVDLLIATLGVTPERQRVIDFTTPYRWGASDVVVKKDSGISKISDLKGKTLATLKGSVQAKWFEDHMPEVKTLRMNSAADALQTFRQGRADAYTHDAATLVVVADNDQDARLLKNDEQWRDYLSAAIARMHEEKLFRGWIEQFVPQNIQGYYISVFEQPKPAEAL